MADIFIYSALAWYFSQVWPSKVGVPKPFYFPLQSHYWFPTLAITTVEAASNSLMQKSGSVESLEGGGEGSDRIPIEPVNESLLGRPTVSVKNLKKSFGGQYAVNDLSFDMYPNQIFALLGHVSAPYEYYLLLGFRNYD